MIWPSNLVNTSLFYALHDTSPTNPAETNGWKIGRYRWFCYVFLGSFVWYWFPGFLAQFLSTFAFVTWLKPNDVIINQLFGGSTGLSLLPITFDWTVVTGYIFSPLMAPWHAIANTLIGVVIFFWFTTMAVHYSGGWFAAYLPISDSQSYDNTGSVYNVTKILTPELELDLTKYEAYSPLFLSTTFSLTYGLSFAAISAVIVHTALFHAREIWSKVREAQSNEDDEDVHFRLMKKYREVPAWWYHVVLVLMTAASLVCVLAYDTHLSWWAFFLALGISFAWSIPIGMIQAVTNIQMGLNVFTGMHFHPPSSALLIPLRIHRGLCSTWQTACDDDVQNLRLHHHGTSPRIRCRPQTRPLHENPATYHVLHSNRGHRLVLHRSDPRARMGPRQHPRRVHSHPSQ